MVTTDFGAVPLMVLCPYVYLLSDAEVGRVRLQPTEVSSAHWVPIAALLDPSARTYERADIVDRFASRWGKTARTVLGWSLGQALYAAVRLRPSESLFSAESETRSSEAMTSNRGGVWTRLREVIREDTFSTLSKWGIAEAEPDDSRRLLLWGLTHGITCDFLGLLPTAKGLDWWRWPTLSRSDVRFVVWIVSYRFRKVKSDAVRMGKMSDVNSPVIIGEGLGTKSLNQSSGASRSPATIYSAAGFLLDGYFEQIQKAVYICFVLRFLFGSAGVWYLIRRYQRNR